MAGQKRAVSWDERPPAQAPPRPAPPAAASPAAPPPVPPPHQAQRPPPPPAQARPQPQPQFQARSAPAPAPVTPPHEHYVPPSYNATVSGGAPGAGAGSRAQPPPRPAPAFASSMEDWQAKRAAEKAGPDHEEALRSQLDRGPATQAAPQPAPASYPVYTRGRKSQWPLAKPLAIIILVAVVLAALQLHGELGGAREFLDRDMSKGLPLFRAYPLSTEFKMNRLLSTTCRGGEVDYFLDVAIPSTLAGQQEIVELAETPAPTRIAGGYWNWSGQLNGGEQLAVTISYHVRAYYYQWDLKASDSGTTAQVAGYTQYLGDCWKFTPNEPAIKSLGAELAGNTTNVLEKVINVYQWVHSNIAYMGNSPAEPKTPLQTMADGAGDCDDQSFFMGSLLRSQGVPAWMELGMLYDQSTRQWGGHAWMRVFIPLAEGGGRVVNIDPANNEFLFRDSFRMTDYVDDGSAANLKNYYILWRYTYTGAPPLREDRLDSIEFTSSTDTAGVTGSGPSLSDNTPGKLWRAPGFDCILAVPAVALSIILVGRRRRIMG